MIFNILDNTTELWMAKYIIGEFFSSGGATLYKNPSDQTVIILYYIVPVGPLKLSIHPGIGSCQAATTIEGRTIVSGRL